MNSANLIINIIAREHPKTLMLVNEKIKSIKEGCLEFTELNVLSTYFNFGKLSGIDVRRIKWTNSTAERRDMIAFMLLTFCPERIYGFTEKVPIWGFNVALSGITGCSKAIISKDITKVCDYFQIYPDDRKRWMKLIEK